MHKIQGTVINGEKRGKDLGFPTANVKLHQKIPEGIYVSIVRIEDKDYPSVTFIGQAIQFGEDDYKSETYILDFDQDLYGREISVKLTKKIRGNMKFDSVELLVQQMKKDIKEAREFFRDSETLRPRSGRASSE